MPYFWCAVTSEERRSDELGKRFVHTKLQLMSTEDGPTEVGGLILDPAYRRHPERCGKALSIVRFAYISLHPDRVEREVIAEMLSPFEAPGQNLLWDAFGARFTGLAYREADHLSSRTKQFIADLFPRDPVYATLFPKEVQAVIGQPGETAKAAVRILEKIGFRYLSQVDPFDGGRTTGLAGGDLVGARAACAGAAGPGRRARRAAAGLPRVACGGGPRGFPRHRGSRGRDRRAVRLQAVSRGARRPRRRPRPRDAAAVRMLA
jgi:arginine N-succinyltransferase